MSKYSDYNDESLRNHIKSFFVFAKKHGIEINHQDNNDDEEMLSILRNYLEEHKASSAGEIVIFLLKYFTSHHQKKKKHNIDLIQPIKNNDPEKDQILAQLALTHQKNHSLSHDGAVVGRATPIIQTKPKITQKTTAKNLL